MLTNIKQMMGISNNDFDSLIKTYISSAKKDLQEVGIAEEIIEDNDPLTNTAIISYVLSLLDVQNAEMYASSYMMQKDMLRHLKNYQEGE